MNKAEIKLLDLRLREDWVRINSLLVDAITRWLEEEDPEDPLFVLSLELRRQWNMYVLCN